MRLRPFLVTNLVLLSVLAPGLAAQEGPRPGSAPAGGGGRIAGAVVIAETGQPLNAAAITIRGAGDSVVVAGGLTDADGKFRIEGLSFGRYSVRVSHLGYQPLTLQVLVLSSASPAADMGTIKLEVAAVALPGVEAVGERSAVVLEADRTVYNTKDMPAAGGTAINVMRNVPELEVDLNGKITLRGNQQVAIHMNGRPAPLRGEQLTNFLQQNAGQPHSQSRSDAQPIGQARSGRHGRHREHRAQGEHRPGPERQRVAECKHAQQPGPERAHQLPARAFHAFHRWRL